MQRKIFRSGTLVVFFVSLLSFSGLAGRDSFEIYLNNKLVQKQYVGFSTASLLEIKLDKTNNNDQLVIYYIHCNIKGAGKGRNMVVKNAQNQVVKEWKFADVTNGDASMSIPVKDILALQKNQGNATLNLYYFSSQELPDGQVLAAIKPGNKSVSYLKQPKEYIPELHREFFAWVAKKSINLTCILEG